MHTDIDHHCNDSHRQELALRMIRHEARTCTIRDCTDLSDDRIRRIYKTFAAERDNRPARRHRGKSPRQVTYFIRNAHAQFESAVLASAFTAFGLLRTSQDTAAYNKLQELTPLDFGRLFCDAYETYQQLLSNPTMSFEHAWFLMQLLDRGVDLNAARCRHCDTSYLRDRFNLCQHPCPTCRLKRTQGGCSKVRISEPAAIAVPRMRRMTKMASGVDLMR